MKKIQSWELGKQVIFAVLGGYIGAILSSGMDLGIANYLIFIYAGIVILIAYLGNKFFYRKKIN